MPCLSASRQIGVRAVRFAHHTIQRRHLISRNYCFSVIFTSIFLAKLLHLDAHLHSIPPLEWLLLGPTFFFQDVAVVLVARVLTEEAPWSKLRIIPAVGASMFRYVSPHMSLKHQTRCYRRTHELQPFCSVHSLSQHLILRHCWC